MPNQDTTPIKEKIIQTIKIKGPSLPVRIAKEIEQNTLFTSAFLSELLSEKKLKISHMRVGSSPLYFLQGQESHLEKFSHYLKSKEKEAFILIKEEKILKDSNQDPAIRVALREIKDFAIPFKKEEEIFWRYFTIPESEFIEKKEIKPKKTEEEKQPPKENPKSQEKIREEKPTKELNIFDKKPKSKKRKIATKNSQKKNEKFFNKVKEFLSRKGYSIIDIDTFNKNDLILKIDTPQGERLLIAYNKKRINEQDIIKASKKASESNLKYIILSLGNPLKKIENLINALKYLSELEKVEG